MDGSKPALFVCLNDVDTNNCTFYSAYKIGCTDSRSARLL